MASRYKIDCINKRDHYDPHTRISHVGGLLATGVRYRESIDKVISEIEVGNWSFFVVRNGFEANVEVATSAYGNKYLRTVADKTTLDNLLSLNECPLY